MNIILGSSSEGRRLIMEELGIPFIIMSPDIDEKLIRKDTPEELVMAIALAKSEVLLSQIDKPSILITSDQVVVCNRKMLEKPINVDEAREFLNMYALYPLETVGAIVVVNTKTKKRVQGLQNSKVFLKPLPVDVIERHIVSGQSLRGAGGILVHDKEIKNYIDHIEGTIDSATGLSKDLVLRLIEEVEK